MRPIHPHLTLAARRRFRIKYIKRRDPARCWPWKHVYQRYGMFSLKSQEMLAHRVAFVIHHDREVTAGMHVLHTCDNPCCVNPAHLWEGTHRDNMQDMMSKGRWKTGPRRHCSHTPKPPVEVVEEGFEDENPLRSYCIGREE